ncbi:Hypothetical predicted protein [Pelobates cultripes]|uniref:Uncharacterized protein n=1 Tax=Pelobates cultripes TaxID=61616 RepID=A0AAD1T300_PELCU|nr:Hypothetical predicted protein [Pelobates cultripes]
MAAAPESQLLPKPSATYLKAFDDLCTACLEQRKQLLSQDCFNVVDTQPANHTSVYLQPTNCYHAVSICGRSPSTDGGAESGLIHGQHVMACTRTWGWWHANFSCTMFIFHDMRSGWTDSSPFQAGPHKRYELFYCSFYFSLQIAPFFSFSLSLVIR